jgi:hypothetical protein
MSDFRSSTSYAIRVVGVTAGLSLAGAAAGAVVGLVMTLVTGGFASAPSIAAVLLPAAGVGAGCGAILFPVGAWTLMRSVPLGRALLWTLVPSSIGAAVGLGFFGLTAPVGILGATLGFAAAALLLRRSARSTAVVARGA